MAGRRALGIALAGALLAASLAFGKPLLSAEVARLIDSHGIDAARERLGELAVNTADNFEPDLDGLADLGTRYLQEGDIEAGMAVMEMLSIISLGELDAALQAQAALMAELEATAEAVAAETEAAPGNRHQPPAPDRGPAREDLERLTGVYASDEAPARELFVTRSCDGFLIVGPLWADTAPWNLRSEGMEVFTYLHDGLHFRLEFTVGGDGVARGLSHSIRGLATPMQRLGPLPDNWPQCQPAGRDARGMEPGQSR